MRVGIVKLLPSSISLTRLYACAQFKLRSNFNGSSLSLSHPFCPQKCQKLSSGLSDRHILYHPEVGMICMFWADARVDPGECQLRPEGQPGPSDLRLLLRRIPDYGALCGVPR